MSYASEESLEKVGAEMEPTTVKKRLSNTLFWRLYLF